LAINRKKKEMLLGIYAKNLERSNALFFTKYQGLTVNQMNTLRRKLQNVDGGYMIVKNTLAQKALAEAGLPKVDEIFEGPVGISFCYGDPPPVAKALTEFAKEEDLLEIKGGLLGNVFLDEKAVKDLADLPPLEVIQAQLLGVISAPASQLAGVIASGMRQVMNVINAYAESGESESAAIQS
jgi:large subunit ribosomal protein L10